jgi:hypothetical protein
MAGTKVTGAAANGHQATADQAQRRIIMTAKIARAHLNEFPDSYTRLAKMEAEAEAEAHRNAQGE